MEDARRDSVSTLFGWDGMVPRNARIDISDKLAEARYFLARMERVGDLDEFRWLTSACLNACQSAIDWLAWEVRHVLDDPDSGFEPDDRAERAMKPFFDIFPQAKASWQVRARSTHPLLQEMNRLRKETAHYGPLHIDRLPPRGGESFAAPGEAFVFCQPAPPRGDYRDFLDYSPGKRVVPFLREVLTILEAAQDAATDSP